MAKLFIDRIFTYSTVANGDVKFTEAEARDLNEMLTDALQPKTVSMPGVEGATPHIGVPNNRVRWEMLALTSYKIDAIKEFRRVYNVGLKDAKDAVERYLADVDTAYGRAVQKGWPVSNG